MKNKVTYPMKTAVILFIVMTLLMNSCNTIAADKNKAPYQPGVAISFDDLYVNEWYEAN
jgi:hypothetical protein